MIYKTIIADPPWEMPACGKRQRERDPASAEAGFSLDYPTMTIAEICALPVADQADTGCHLYLWTANAVLREAFEVLDAWGFKYLVPLHWVKPSGVGNWWRHLSQTVLFGYRPPLAMKAKHVENVFKAPVPRYHSRKPEALHIIAEHVSSAPRLEMFARPPFRDGWDVSGNETEGGGVVQTLLPATVRVS